MNTRLTWPADRFYWAVLEAPGVHRAGPLPSGLLSVVAEEIPDQTDGLHAVCVPISDGRLAVCIARGSDLAALAPEVERLTPQSPPDSLGLEGVDPSRFNLLVGAKEPRAVSRARLRRHAWAAGVALVCGLLIAVGLQRRSSVWHDRADSARSAGRSLADRVAPSAGVDGLAREAERLANTRDGLAAAKPPPDASVALAAVLDAWPTSVASKPQSITVNPTGVSVSVSMEDDATAFLRAFKAPTGWVLQEPRLNSADGVTRLALELRPEGWRP